MPLLIVGIVLAWFVILAVTVVGSWFGLKPDQAVLLFMTACAAVFVWRSLFSKKNA